MKRILYILVALLCFDAVVFAQTSINTDEQFFGGEEPSAESEEPAQPVISDREIELWQNLYTLNANPMAPYQDVMAACAAYIGEFPEGFYLEEARAILKDEANRSQADEEAWQRALLDNTIEAYAIYYRNYITHRDEANARRTALEKEDKSWQAACKENTSDAYSRFLIAYPQGRYKIEAEQRKRVADDNAAWVVADQTGTMDAYQRYLAMYDLHTDEASEKIDELRWVRCHAADNIPAYEEYLTHKNGKHRSEAQKRMADLQRQSDLLIRAAQAIEINDYYSAYYAAVEARGIGGLSENQTSRALKYEEPYAYSLVDNRDATLEQLNDYIKLYGSVTPPKHLEKLIKRRDRLQSNVDAQAAKAAAAKNPRAHKQTEFNPNRRYWFAEISTAYGITTDMNLKNSNWKSGDWMLGFDLGMQRRAVGLYVEYMFTMNNDTTFKWNDTKAANDTTIKFKAYNHLASLGPSFRLTQNTKTDVSLWMAPSIYYANRDHVKAFNKENFMYGGGIGLRLAPSGRKEHRFAWWTINFGTHVLYSPYNKHLEFVPQISLSIVPGAAAVTALGLMQYYNVF